MIILKIYIGYVGLTEKECKVYLLKFENSMNKT